jgi:uroporphyrinogen-III synthase
MQSLEGFTVGVTADRGSDEQRELLEAHGVTVVHGACLRSVITPDDGELRTATRALLAHPPDVLIANTGIGLRRWFALAHLWGLGDELVEVLGGARIVARSARAAGAVVSEGLVADRRTASGTLVEVIDGIVRSSAPGARVALQLDGGGSPGVAAALRRAGFVVTELDVYRWSSPREPDATRRLVDAILDDSVDVVTFTAPPAVRGLLRAAAADRDAVVGAFARTRLLAACVGPVTAAVAAEEGLGAPIVPPTAKLPALVRAVQGQLEAQVLDTRLVGRAARLRGTLLEVGPSTVRLTPRERRLLEALLARRDAVCSKESLAQAAWWSRVDEHTVEVTVNRLRRKLGPAAAAIETTPRRGYRLVTDVPGGFSRPTGAESARSRA